MDSFTNIWLANWYWIVPLIVGVVALALAVSPFLQMKYGKPKIELRYNVLDTDSKDTRFLECGIVNKPITNRFLRAWGIQRNEAQDVFVRLTITDLRTKQLVIHDINPNIYTDRDPEHMRPVLPFLSSFISAHFVVSATTQAGATNTMSSQKYKKTHGLTPGDYFAIIIVSASEDVFTFDKSLHVGTKMYDTYWVENGEQK